MIQVVQKRLELDTGRRADARLQRAEEQRWRIGEFCERAMHEFPRARARECDRIVGIRASRARKIQDRKSTRLNSSHQIISYAVIRLKKQNTPLGHSRL